MTPYTTGHMIQMSLGDNGQLDLDWFTDLSAVSWGAGLEGVASAYVFGKSLWVGDKIRRRDDVANWHLEEAGERTALLTAAYGVHYRQIFSKQYFDRECGKYNLRYPE